jgi:hypothetical protein
MAAGGLLWTFTRLNPVQTDTAPVTLTLGGWAAPFGRPRNGSIFDAGVENRYQRTDYPGRNLPPTIHNFGTKKMPIEMHGRWMDKTIPMAGGAQIYSRNWQDFVTAGSVVRMTWGQALSYQIYITKINLEVESYQEIVWKLHAEVLVDEQAPIWSSSETTSAPFDIASRMQFLMEIAGNQHKLAAPFQSFTSLMGMLNGISDSLAILQSEINAPFAAIYNTCSALTSFETAISSDLTGLLSGVVAMQTGILNLRTETDFLLSSAQFLNSPDEVALNGVAGGILTGADVAELVIQKQQNDAVMANMLALLGQMEAQINMNLRGTPKTAYTAQMGDTWESIGERVLGSADAGRAIKDMNGIRYGVVPVPGTQYSIPK